MTFPNVKVITFGRVLFGFNLKFKENIKLDELSVQVFVFYHFYAPKTRKNIK